MNTEERQLTEMLHRITPEPPRRVTVEDIAFRLANQAGPDRQPRSLRRSHREPRLRRPSSRGRAWAPVLAAASVFALIGASAGIAVLVSSHHSSSSPSVAVGNTTSSAAPASSSATGPAATATPIPGAPWGAGLVNHLALMPASLTGSGDSLYAFAGQDLVRIEPATGAIVRSVPAISRVMNAPVVLGGTVWVVSYYEGDQVFMDGYDAQTLAHVRSVTVTANGPLSTAGQGVLTAGPDGYLYLAAGDSVAVVNPANGAVVRRIQTLIAPSSSVAVSPDGSRLYVSIASPNVLLLQTYDLTKGGAFVGQSRLSVGSGGSLVATSGGVWGTLGSGMSQWVWFAPGGNLSSALPVTRGAGGGLISLPSAAEGAIWIGGSHTLACADPATGKVRASGTIPADHGTAEYFGSVTYAGGHAYAYYVDTQSGVQGLATVSPPASCTS